MSRLTSTYNQIMKVCKCCAKSSIHSNPRSNTCNTCLESGFKYCPVCEQVLSINSFGKVLNGLRGTCKKCTSRKSMESAKAAGYVRIYTDETRRISREYCLEHREVISAKRKARYATDEEFRQQIKNINNNRRANTAGTLSLDEWEYILHIFNHSCAYCGSVHDLTQDHIIPLNADGLNVSYNIVPACKSCNSSKGARSLINWYKKQVFFNESKLHKVINWLNGEVYAK